MNSCGISELKSYFVGFLFRLVAPRAAREPANAIPYSPAFAVSPVLTEPDFDDTVSLVGVVDVGSCATCFGKNDS